MSDRKLESVHATVDAFNRRDVQAFLRICDPDAELLDRLTLNPNVYRGREEIAGWFQGWDKVWDSIHGSLVGVVYEDEDVIVWRARARARGKGSGADVSQDFWLLARFRGETVVRMETYRSETDALDAVGTSG